MVQTRSMSKKTDPKIAVHKVVERASKQTRKEKMNSNVKVTKKVRTKNADCYSRPVTIDDDARIIFMEDYIIRHPLGPNTGFLPIYAGYSEWNQMSARDKAPFIKKARERNAKPAFDHHALYY